MRIQAALPQFSKGSLDLAWSFNEVINTAEERRWLSGEHFSVDGTLIQACAGHKSFVPKSGDDDDAGETNSFKGKRRSNETHESKTDPDSRLFCKGKTVSELRYGGYTLTDDRHGLVVPAMVTQADGHAEREAAKAMIKDARQAAADPKREVTLGAGKGYDAADVIEELQRLQVTPHIAQNKSGRRSAVPVEIAATEAYALSQRKRKLIEQGFGPAKFVGPIRQVMVCGIEKVDQLSLLTMAAYNLTRTATGSDLYVEVLDASRRLLNNKSATTV